MKEKGGVRHHCSRCDYSDIRKPAAQGVYVCTNCGGGGVLRPEYKTATLTEHAPPKPKPVSGESCFVFKGIKKNSKQETFNW